MKKKTIHLLLAALVCCISTLSFCQNDPTIPCSQLPKKPVPATAVNDFANIIDDDAQQSMENEIRAYWDSTSIALVIVTVQNMSGNQVSEYALSLFRCWGIGGSESNRGILFLISMDEHKIWIATGYGVEGILPDITCYQITENYVKPLCKEEKYSDAVVAGVRKIFQTLGTMSWEERMEGIKAEKAKDEQRLADIKETALYVILSIIFLVLVILLIRRISKNAERKKLRKQMQDLIVKTTNEVLNAWKRIETSLEWYKAQARWAQEEAQDHKAEALKALNQAKKALVEASYMEDFEKAEQYVLSAQRLIEKSFNNFLKIDKDLKEKIKKFSSEAPLRLESAKQQLIKSFKILSGYVAQGYKIPHAVSEQNDFKKIIDDYEGKINNSECHQLIYTQAQIIYAKSAELTAQVSAMIQKHMEITKNMTILVAGGKKQYEHAKDCMSVFEQYKSCYLESVWYDQEMLLKKLIAKLEPQRLDTLSVEILESNNMERQEFTAAAIKYDELLSQIDQIPTLCTIIRNIGTHQEESKQSYSSKSLSTEELVKRAMQKVKDSDVTSSTKAIAKSAQQKFEEAKIQSSKSILDWVALILFLDSITDLANKVIHGAENDINNAKKERYEEVQRKIREKKEENSNSYKSLSGTSYISSYDPSPTFGGLSGGDSGGGGGGTTW